MFISAIHQHESAIGMYMSPPSWTSFPSPTPSHPSMLAQSTGFELPAVYSKFHWLSILHMVVHMLLNCGVGEDFSEPLDCKEIQPVHPKGNQSWIFIERTDVEAETPIFWPPDWKNWLTRKDPDAGKDWRQEEKGTTEDEMVGSHHRLNGHEFE